MFIGLQTQARPRPAARGLTGNHSRAAARGLTGNHSRAAARILTGNHSRAAARVPAPAVLGALIGQGLLPAGRGRGGRTPPVLCQPAVEVPENIVTMEETLELAALRHPGHPNLALALRLIRGTGVRKRHLILPLDQVLQHPGFEQRNLTYVRHAKMRVPPVVRRALDNAGVTPQEVDAIVFVSCTGFTMPPLTAWLINSMGFRPDTRQIPIAQLGCAAGGAAINRAHDFCLAHPGANVLIVSCEFCSMCYQPTDIDVGSLLSDGLFGDAVAAAVVRSEGGTGIQLERNGCYLIPGTEDWISYAVKSTGFHFRLDKRVPTTMEPLAPVLRDLVTAHGWDASRLGFYIIHAGGPRILDDLSRFLGVGRDAFRHSRATLTEYGNIASAVVLDALARLFDEGGPGDGSGGIVAGFGPGIIAEMAVGRWVASPQPGHYASAREAARGGGEQKCLTA